MLSKQFQQKIYDAYRYKTGLTTVRNGNYEYSIQYNPGCVISTWIVRRKGNEEWKWLQPLKEDIR